MTLPSPRRAAAFALRAAGVLAGHLFVLAFVLFAAFPVYWMISTSFKSRWDAFRLPPVWWFQPTLEHYAAILSGQGWISEPMSYLLLNSAIVAGSASLLALGAGSLSAYGLSRFPSGYSKHLAMWILSTRMFPPVAVAIPVFLMMSSLDLIDTYWALIVPYAAFNISFVVWMMRSFFDQIPVELEQAAMIDGCSRLSAFFRVVLPLSLPGLVATAVFVLIFSWNEFLFALILTRTAAKTAPVAAADFVTLYGIQWGELTAHATLISAPIIILGLLFSRYIVKGLTLGAVQ
jgi:ABC-type glycerol-3-phosphate transport system permease component